MSQHWYKIAESTISRHYREVSEFTFVEPPIRELKYK
jgi:hypothetical protein